MDFKDEQAKIQKIIAEFEIDGWLFYDYHGSNLLAYHVLAIPQAQLLTRRFFYWIPSEGECVKIVPSIEPYTLDHLPGKKILYRTWQELDAHLSALLSGKKKIAMEYSPYNALPNVSKVDAGTVEWIRSKDVEVVSSADCLQLYKGKWSDEQLNSHLEAADVLNRIAEETWTFIKISLQSDQLLTEYNVQQFMLAKMHKAGCITADAPICAINANAANPHYSPNKETSLVLKKGDFILLDLWCKKDRPHAVYADITRVGIAAKEPTSLQQEVFRIVKKAQEQATEYVVSQYSRGIQMEGWQVDRVCREVIQASGYGEFFVHRTGHSIGEDVHSFGANLDDFETHDTRRLLQGTCFSVEPGIYLPQQFGIRLEYDVYLGQKGEVKITGGCQEEIVCLFS